MIREIIEEWPGAIYGVKLDDGTKKYIEFLHKKEDAIIPGFTNEEVLIIIEKRLHTQYQNKRNGHTSNALVHLGRAISCLEEGNKSKRRNKDRNNSETN